MRVLVDTHIFIWCDRRPNVVASALMAVLRDTRNEIFVSVASVWEIAIKRETGKLELRAGSEQHMHLVEVTTKDGAQKIGLVALDLPTRLEKHDSKDIE